MSRFSSTPDRAKASVGVLLFIALAGVAACDEDGKTAPERCADPALPIFDIQAAGEPGDDNAKYPCVTQVGHSINQGTPDSSSTGGGTGGTAGAAGKGGASSTTDAAGAGGA
jgi:hypothetical protein